MTENKAALSGQDSCAETSAASFLLLLLAADAVFLFLHISWQSGILHQPMYAMSRDASFPEHYQYTKELWVAVLLFCVCVRTREWGYVVWAAIFVYLMCDDALSFHERGGAYLAEKLDFIPLFGKLRLGEPAVSAMVAALTLPLLAWRYVKGAEAFKQLTRHLLLFFCALAFFAVVVDILAVFKPHRSVGFILKTVEEGGEAFVMSLMTWYAYLRNARDGAFSTSLPALVRDALSRLLPKPRKASNI